MAQMHLGVCGKIGGGGIPPYLLPMPQNLHIAPFGDSATINRMMSLSECKSEASIAFFMALFTRFGFGLVLTRCGALHYGKSHTTLLASFPLCANI